MRKAIILLSLWLVAGQVYSQIRSDPNPLLFRPATHSNDLKSTANPYNGKSFYQSKADWQTIIDTTWGPGLPLNEKFAIFDFYTQALNVKFGGFNSLGINQSEWDSIRTSYRSRIDSSTSKGSFAALMGRLAYELHGYTTLAWDTIVLLTPLNLGTPILDIGDHIISHFGAVLTDLPDSSLLVLRTIDNHPLGLQPGDIVLGYEGVPWKNLVDELLGSDIPLLSFSRGAKSAFRYNELVSAGMNWHLFETIDIVKYAGGDTVHLPVYPLLNLPVPIGEFWLGGKNLLWNNEQLPVEGVPFPDPNEIADQTITYGIIEGTNIGYIYLIIENDVARGQFNEAVKSLSETEGLIIDLRINFGGDPIPNDVISQLFNTHQNTLGFHPGGIAEICSIYGNPISWYDQPIAVLTGPNCLGSGELLAYMLGFHPMTRFFGKSTSACVSNFSWLGNFPDYWLSIADLDFYSVKNPGILLNFREFPIDDSIWFEKESVANGEDAVVIKAIEWIQNVSYAHEASVNPGYAVPGAGEVTLTAQVENPDEHDVAVKALITSKDSTVSETVSLFDDGNHGDGNAGDGTWGTIWTVPDIKAIFSADLQTDDLTAGTTLEITSAVKFTTIGPIVVVGKSYTGGDTIPNAGDYIEFKVVLRNNDLTTPVTKIKVKLTSLDTALAKTPDFNIGFPDIAPGEVSTNLGIIPFYINIADNCPPNTIIPVKIEISSDYYTLWVDTIPFLVHGPLYVADINTLPARVYPNPAEDKINIEIDNTSEQETVIELVTVTGTVIYRKEYRNSMDHFTRQIDVSGYARGLYFFKIRQAGAVYNGKIIVR